MSNILNNFNRQLSNISENSIFDKIDSNKNKSKARKSIRQLISNLSSKISEISSVRRIEDLIEHTFEKLYYINDEILNEKKIDLLINKLRNQCDNFLDDFKEKTFDSDLSELELEFESDERSSSEQSDDSDSDSDSESDSDLSSDSDESESEYSSSEQSDESESDDEFDVKENYNKLQELGYFTCNESDCSCTDVFECQCSESDCSCDEEDNLMSRKKLTQLKKFNKKFNKKINANKMQTESSETEVSEPKVSSSNDNYIHIFEVCMNKIKDKNTPAENIKKLVETLEKLYNKLNTENKKYYQDEVEILTSLYL